MPKKLPFVEHGRRRAAEDMLVNGNRLSAQRGRRIAPRTDACRPCLIWLGDDTSEPMQGVMLDLNPYGMKVRMLDQLPEGMEVTLQMMRDEEFRVPLSPPIHARVMRVEDAGEGFFDHGLKVRIDAIKRVGQGRPVPIKKLRPSKRTPTRMYSLELGPAERSQRRSGRNRG